MRVFLRALISLMVLAGSATLWVPEAWACEVGAVRGGVACVGEDGEAEWENHHPALWASGDAYREGEDPRWESSTVVQGEEFFYSLRGDVLMGDVADGVIRRRVRYPALIEELRWSDEFEGLEVVLDTREGPMTARYVPGGPGPAQGFWDEGFVEFTAIHDAVLLQDSEALARGQRQDRTNPFYAIAQGTLLLKETGDDDAADVLFRQALEVEGGTWQDYAMAAADLLEWSLGEEAAELFERALEERAALGLSAERVRSLVYLMILSRGLGPTVISEAVDREDYSGAHEAMDYLYRLAPFVDNGGPLWLDFSIWLEEGGEGALASLWSARGEANMEASEKAHLGFLIRSNLGNFLYYSTFAWITLLVLIMTLRGVLRRRESSGQSGLVLPDLLLREVAVLVAAVVLATAAAGYMSTNTWMMIGYTNIPDGVLGDGLASPLAMEWIADLEPSEAQEALWLAAVAEREAFLTGEARRPPPQVSDLVYEAVRGDIAARQDKNLDYSGFFGPMAGVFATVVYALDAGRHLVLLLAGLFGAVLLAIILGNVSRRGGRVVLGILPGGPPIWSVLAALNSLGGAALLLAWLSVDDTLLHLIAGGGSFFGTSELEVHTLRPARGWMLVVLVLVVACQLEALWKWRKIGWSLAPDAASVAAGAEGAAAAAEESGQV